MLTSLMFPSRYYQGKDSLLQFYPRAKEWGKSFLFIGSKSALNAAQAKLEKSFEGTDGTCSFELFAGIPNDKEYDRVRALVETRKPEVVCAIGGGSVIDVCRAAAMKTGRPIVVIPTTVASDAACTNVCVHYSEDGSHVLGADIFHRGPDLVFVDSTVIAEAPVRQLLSGMGDALATFYESDTCRKNGVDQYGELKITYTAVELSRACRDILLEYGESAVLACENNIVTPAFENVIEACALLSGVGGINAGCAGAHGWADFLSTLPGGHSYMHGERVAIGLIMQLIIEDHPTEEIEEIISFCLRTGMPTCIRDMGYTDLGDIAEQIGKGTEDDFFIGHMNNIDHCAAAIKGAALAAVALTDRVKALI